MNKLDERRRALLAGKVPRTWVYKEGSQSVENGSRIVNSYCTSLYWGCILISKVNSSVSRIIIETDFTGYSKLFIEANVRIVKGPGTAQIGYTGNYVNITATRQIYEFDISNVNGLKEITGDANREYSNGELYNYIYNIWLE